MWNISGGKPSGFDQGFKFEEKLEKKELTPHEKMNVEEKSSRIKALKKPESAEEKEKRQQFINISQLVVGEFGRVSTKPDFNLRSLLSKKITLEDKSLTSKLSNIKLSDVNQLFKKEEPQELKKKWMEQISKEPKALKNAPKAIREDTEILTTFISKMAQQCNTENEKIEKENNEVKSKMQTSGASKEDIEVCLKKTISPVNKMIEILEASGHKNVNKNPNLMYLLIDIDYNAFKLADPSLKDDPKFVKPIVEKYPWLIAHTTDKFLKTNKDIVVTALKTQYHPLLKFLPKTLRRDPEIAQLALKNNLGEIGFVMGSQNQKLILEELKKNRNLIKHIHFSYFYKKDFIHAVTVQNPTLWVYIEKTKDKYQQDFMFNDAELKKLKGAIAEHNPQALKFFNDVSGDLAFIKKVMKKNPAVLLYASLPTKDLDKLYESLTSQQKDELQKILDTEPKVDPRSIFFSQIAELPDEVIGNISDFAGVDDSLKLRLVSEKLHPGVETSSLMNVTLTNWIGLYLKKDPSSLNNEQIKKMNADLLKSKVRVYSAKNIEDLKKLHALLQKNKLDLKEIQDTISNKILAILKLYSPAHDVAEENLSRLVKGAETLFSCSETTNGYLWLDPETGVIKAFWGHDSSPALYDGTKSTDLQYGTNTGVVIGGRTFGNDRSHNFIIEIPKDTKLSPFAKEVLNAMHKTLVARDSKAIGEKQRYVYGPWYNPKIYEIKPEYIPKQVGVIYVENRR